VVTNGRSGRLDRLRAPLNLRVRVVLTKVIHGEDRRYGLRNTIANLRPVPSVRCSSGHGLSLVAPRMYPRDRQQNKGNHGVAERHYHNPVAMSVT
jgi:hypothetical protein